MPEGHHTLVRRFQRQLEEVLSAIIARGTRVAVLVVPRHTNVGDSAIWLGQWAVLRRLGARIVYASDMVNYSPAVMRARLGAGTILLKGGGDLGDVWERSQQYRESVLSQFRDNPIVQLPQSLHFSVPENLDRARAAFDAHPNLTLLLRDTYSLEQAREHFAATSLLCIDTAFGLGPLSRRPEGTPAVRWLARTDHEAEHAAPEPVDGELAVGDWIQVSYSKRARALLRQATVVEHRLLAKAPVGTRRLLVRAMLETYNLLARERLAVGRRLLGRPRVVVTDRLHAHILCLLLGVPHVVLDNSYGKLSRFTSTWGTCPSDLAHWAGSPAEALEIANELAAADGSP